MTTTTKNYKWTEMGLLYCTIVNNKMKLLYNKEPNLPNLWQNKCCIGPCITDWGLVEDTCKKIKAIYILHNFWLFLVLHEILSMLNCWLLNFCLYYQIKKQLVKIIGCDKVSITGILFLILNLLIHQLFYGVIWYTTF